MFLKEDFHVQSCTYIGGGGCCVTSMERRGYELAEGFPGGHDSPPHRLGNVPSGVGGIVPTLSQKARKDGAPPVLVVQTKSKGGAPGADALQVAQRRACEHYFPEPRTHSARIKE